jgi:hypothetical protein
MLVTGRSPADAADVALELTTQARFEAGRLTVHLSVRNRGGEAAISLGSTLHFRAGSTPGGERVRLGPGETWAESLTMPTGDLGPGRWVYVVALRYARGDGHPLEALRVGTVTSGEPGASEIDITEVVAAPFTWRGGLGVTVRNRGAGPRRVTVTAHLPRGIEPGSPGGAATAAVDLEGGGQRRVTIPLANRFQVPGMQGYVPVSVEYDAGGVHHAVVAETVVTTAQPLSILTRRRTSLWAIAAVGVVTWMAASGWWLLGRARRPAGGGAIASGRDRLRTIIDCAVLLATTAFVLAFLPRHVLSPTTPTGGDMASHYYALVYLRDVLLPGGQVSGWCPGSYAGFPLFQLYFPLPFVLMVVLAVAMPLAVAFKLVTVASVVALPLAAYASLRLLRIPFPGPALGAIGSLCFLFMEATSMWGGNIASMLTGEFTYSMGMALAVLFVGTLSRTMETGRGVARNGLLVAAIGLSHGYPLLWAGAVSLTALIAVRRWWWRLGVLVRIHGLALLLMSFWLVPLLWYAPWGTQYDHVWPLQSWTEIVPFILWPAAALAVAFAPVLIVLAWRRPQGRTAGPLWAGIAIAVAFYFVAPSLGLVDFRFLPFLQLGLCLAAAVALGTVLSALPAPELWPILAALATLPLVQSQVRYVAYWALYNYAGFEAKTMWPTFDRLMEHLQGDFRSPRVAYEHAPAHVAFGSERAFENLPLFSGRSTLDGLYMQSSVTAPFVFYVQSEISMETTCPLPEWGCALPDLDRGIPHLRMFNVSQFIARSAPVKQAAARRPDLVRELVDGEYEVFRLQPRDAGDGRYAVALELAPVLVETGNWKAAAYRWLKTASPNAPVPVFTSAASDPHNPGFVARMREAAGELPRHPLPAVPAIAETIGPDRITITGCRPGHPVLIRVSYHPRWRARGGERVYLAGPGFMLVFPRDERVELVFEATGAVRAGQLATLVGCGVLLCTVPALRRRIRPLLVRQGTAILAVPPLRWIHDGVAATAQWSAARRRLVLGVSVVSVGALVAVLGATATPSAHRLYLEAQRRYAAGDLDGALPIFVQVQSIAPLSRFATLGRYFEALIHFRYERWAVARARFEDLRIEFPEAITLAPTLYHLGACEARLGNAAAARDAWQETIRRFPGTEWARRAAEELPAVHFAP